MQKKSVTHPILPVCLLVAGKPCLVVGGGQIAARKAGHLLDAKADVTVVSPEFSAELHSLAQAQKIRLTTRAFSESDLEGKWLVYAATDNQEINLRVIELCHKKGVLCSAADSNWPQGDFVTPAICRKKGLVVTVSSGGRSCLQSRIVKDKIAGLLATMADEAGGNESNDYKEDNL
ncbi:MAG: bifunctional precorrin-2 dehydrogenase/sirohydrochlorin ferrochelatase [bacterium]